jgi:hypothetical protein
VPALAALLLCDVKKESAEAAAELLGRIRDSRSIGPLLSAIKGARSFVPLKAIWAVEQISGLRCVIGEQGVVRNLVVLTRNTGTAENAVQTLRDLVNRGASYISIDDLQCLADLGPVQYSHYIPPIDWDDHGRTETRTYNCSSLNHLAKEEMTRRTQKL